MSSESDGPSTSTEPSAHERNQIEEANKEANKDGKKKDGKKGENIGKRVRQAAMERAKNEGGIEPDTPSDRRPGTQPDSGPCLQISSLGPATGPSTSTEPNPNDPMTPNQGMGLEIPHGGSAQTVLGDGDQVPGFSEPENSGGGSRGQDIEVSFIDALVEYARQPGVVNPPPPATPNKGFFARYGRKMLWILVLVIVVVILVVLVPWNSAGDTNPAPTPPSTRAPIARSDPPTMAPSMAPSAGPPTIPVFPPLPILWTPYGSRLLGQTTEGSFGRSVALSSDGGTLVVGEPGSRSARVLRFEQNADGSFLWKQMGQDMVGNINGGDFGMAVAISSDGNMVAIGAPSGNMIGQVMVYRFVETSPTGGVWSLLGQSLNANARADMFGVSVALNSNGTMLAVGASIGRYARTYRLAESSDDWVAYPELRGNQDNDRYGWAVSLSNDGQTLVVSSERWDGPNSDSGSVNVYRLADSGRWSQFGQRLEGRQQGGRFGISAALSGDGNALVVGAWGDGNGAVRVYRYNNDMSAWEQAGEDIYGISEESFGWATALSEDGTILAASSYTANNFDGLVRVYRDAGDSAWSQVGQTIVGRSSGGFGISVALSANGAVLVSGSSLATNSIMGIVRAGFVDVYIAKGN